MSRCEIIREGQVCNNTADVIVRTPWTTQLACIGCATPFKRYDVEKLEFFCDWPMGGKECGVGATYYFAGEGYQRPLCDKHASSFNLSPLNANVHLIIGDEHFNPKLVPYKPPAQPQPRVVVGGDKAGLWCYCGERGEYRPGVDTMPLCNEHAPSTSKTEPPHVLAAPVTPRASIRDAIEDVVLLSLRVLKEKIEKWR